ncbi:response regulator [Allopontixanthobacter sediminis]|uniref:Response regulator n=1 Tax=Allopontixanthobacter sediminis TaxID=1689985 RepID=A0A845B4X7_9SPHN|nr:response regulator transcription factor [Allopontixanthobacter sediminis]MXP45745.1 response regulator [Allopontixanthobacter sediminis]
MRLLLVEDNARLASLIRDGLQRQGFAIDWYETIEGAQDAVKMNHYDLVLLDLGLPDGDGLELVAQLKRKKDHTPILVMTARGGLDDRVLGLDAGADDYVVKPLEIPELAARCRALLRRPGNALEAVLQAGNVSLNLAERTVHIAGNPTETAPREVDLLEVLLRRTGHVVAKQSIENAIYSMDAEITPNAMEASISRLRKRLFSASANIEIKTVHGVGYALYEPKSVAK